MRIKNWSFQHVHSPFKNLKNPGFSNMSDQYSPTVKYKNLDKKNPEILKHPSFLQGVPKRFPFLNLNNFWIVEPKRPVWIFLECGNMSLRHPVLF